MKKEKYFPGKQPVFSFHMGPSIMSDLVTISTHRIVLEAELAKAALEAEGIEAYIHASHAHDLYPGVLGDVELQVRVRDRERAEEVLKNL